MLQITVCGALMRPLTFWERRPVDNVEESKALLPICNEEKPSSPLQIETIGEECVNEQDNQINELDGSIVSGVPLTKHRDKYDLTRNGQLSFSSPHLKMNTALSHEDITDKPSPLVPRKRVWSMGAKDARHKAEAHHKPVSQPSLHLLRNVLESVSQSQVALYASSNEFAGSAIELSSRPELSKPSPSELTPPEDNVKKSCCSNVKSGFVNVLKVVFDIGLLSNPAFLCFLLMASLVQPGHRLVFTVLPAYAKDVGVSNSQVGVLMAVVSCVDLVARIVVGVVVDHKWVRPTTIIAGTAFLIGTASHFIRFFCSFQSLIAFAVLAGTCCGVYMVLYAMILVDLLTLANLKSSLGFTILCHGLFFAIFIPIVGQLRDATGDYLAAYHFVGALLYVGVGLSIAIPHIHRWREKRVKRAKHHHEMDINVTPSEK